jgi:influenza virus NS1A-binding protein
MIIWVVSLTVSRGVNVVGGYDRAECLRSVELYSPGSNAWASLAPMLEARGRFNIAVIDGSVYAVGGCNGTTELATVERYSAPKRKWERIASLPMARSNTGMSPENYIFTYLLR